MAKVSVIVPIYNVFPYLRQCLDSIVSQTLTDIEIIIVDDGSVDGSAEIADEYAEKDGRIKLIHKTNSGLVNARKIGLRAATAEYAAYVDGDDWIEKNILERTYGQIMTDASSVVIFGHLEYMSGKFMKKASELPAGRYDRLHIKEEILPELFNTGENDRWLVYPFVWDKLFKKRMLSDVMENIDDSISLGEDVACTYPYIINSDAISVIKEFGYCHRQRIDSLSQKTEDKNKARKGAENLYRYVMQFCRNSAEKDILTDQFEYYFKNNIILPRYYSLTAFTKKNDELPGFGHIEKNSNVVIYGAGVLGRELFSYIMRNACCTVSMWVDRNAAYYRDGGLNVRSPENIINIDFDYILIAVVQHQIQDRIRENIINIGQIYEKKIRCFEVEKYA